MIEPPDSLLTAVFPWVEGEQLALSERWRRFGRRGEDFALDQFLLLLLVLRRVLLQDSAVIYTMNPMLQVFQYPPFNTELFRSFAATSSQIIAHAEQDSREQLSALSERAEALFRGIVQLNTLVHQRDHEIQMNKMNKLCGSFVTFSNNLVASMGATQRKKFMSTGMIYFVFHYSSLLSFSQPSTCFLCPSCHH